MGMFVFFASSILENGSVALKHLASGIFEQTFLTALFFNEGVVFALGDIRFFNFYGALFQLLRAEKTTT